MRAEIFGDLIFIDHADMKIGSHTINSLIALDGATTLISSYAPRTREACEVFQCLTEWMDTYPCTPATLCADMVFNPTN